MKGSWSDESALMDAPRARGVLGIVGEDGMVSPAKFFGNEIGGAALLAALLRAGLVLDEGPFTSVGPLDVPGLSTELTRGIWLFGCICRCEDRGAIGSPCCPPISRPWAGR